MTADLPLSYRTSESISQSQPDQTEHDRIAAAGYYRTTYYPRLFTIKEDHRNDQDDCLTCSYIATPALLALSACIEQREMTRYGVEWDPGLTPDRAGPGRHQGVRGSQPCRAATDRQGPAHPVPGRPRPVVPR